MHVCKDVQNRRCILPCTTSSSFTSSIFDALKLTFKYWLQRKSSSAMPGEPSGIVGDSVAVGYRVGVGVGNGVGSRVGLNVVGERVGGSVGSIVGVEELNSAALVGVKVGKKVGEAVGSLQRHLNLASQAPVLVPSLFSFR